MENGFESYDAQQSRLNSGKVFTDLDTSYDYPTPGTDTEPNRIRSASSLMNPILNHYRYLHHHHHHHRQPHPHNPLSTSSISTSSNLVNQPHPHSPHQSQQPLLLSGTQLASLTNAFNQMLYSSYPYRNSSYSSISMIFFSD